MSAALKSYINTTFQPDLDVFIIAFLDNIMVYFNTTNEHREHVCVVLKVLLETGLYMKL